MMIFPLSPLGKITLIMIAIVLGLIYAMLAYPEFWRAFQKDGFEGIKVYRAAKRKERDKK